MKRILIPIVTLIIAGAAVLAQPVAPVASPARPAQASPAPAPPTRGVVVPAFWLAVPPQQAAPAPAPGPRPAAAPEPAEAPQPPAPPDPFFQLVKPAVPIYDREAIEEMKQKAKEMA